jgi:hypothetical protein
MSQRNDPQGIPMIFEFVSTGRERLQGTDGGSTSIILDDTSHIVK